MTGLGDDRIDAAFQASVKTQTAITQIVEALFDISTLYRIVAPTGSDVENAPKCRSDARWWSGGFAILGVMAQIDIRRAESSEHQAVRDLVQIVVSEIYGPLPHGPVPLDEEEDWSLAWVAVSETATLGIVLTHDEWIRDLWVMRQHRGQGSGDDCSIKVNRKLRAVGSRRADCGWLSRMRTRSSSTVGKAGR
jgi:hypothetical protein